MCDPWGTLGWRVLGNQKRIRHLRGLEPETERGLQMWLRERALSRSWGREGALEGGGRRGHRTAGLGCTAGGGKAGSRGRGWGAHTSEGVTPRRKEGVRGSEGPGERHLSTTGEPPRGTPLSCALGRLRPPPPAQARAWVTRLRNDPLVTPHTRLRSSDKGWALENEELPLSAYFFYSIAVCQKEGVLIRHIGFESNSCLYGPRQLFLLV